MERVTWPLLKWCSASSSICRMPNLYPCPSPHFPRWPPGTLIYHNVAPREDDQAARPGNAGERLAYARLPTGVRVIGVNSGYALSFIKDVAEKFRWAASPAEGSQFRSRDVFPQAAAAVALGLPAALGDEIDAHVLPPPPSSVIAYIDGYGNLKTTIAYDAKKVRSGTRIRVRINDHENEAMVSDGAFAVRHGELAFAPGSSGWPMQHGGNIRWMEVFLRGGNAWDLFKHPAIGSAVSIA